MQCSSRRPATTAELLQRMGLVPTSTLMVMMIMMTTTCVSTAGEGDPPVLSASGICPRFHVRTTPGGPCTFALPACEIADGFKTSCHPPTSCECLKQCEDHYLLAPVNGMRESVVGRRGGEAFWGRCFLGGRLGSLEEATQREWIVYNISKTTELGTRRTAYSLRPDDAGNATTPDTNWHKFEGYMDAHGHLLCPNNCMHHGSCQDGVCLCYEGFSGPDCSVNVTSHTVVGHEKDNGFIYVYELPPGMNQWRPRPSPDQLLDMWYALLRSSFRTLDPNKASLFFVPASMLQTRESGVLLALQYVRDNFPYYNRSGGIDHVTVWSYDFGACHVYKDPVLLPTIKVTHFGWQYEQPDVQVAGLCKCRLCGPGGDVVIPDNYEGGFKWGSKMVFNGSAHETERAMFAYWQGSPTSQFRTKLIKLFEDWRDPEGKLNVTISDSRKQYGNLGDMMQNSMFCLEPPAAGFSTRGTLAIIRGCVPVYLHNWKHPFWSSEVGDVLDYSKFSVTIAEEDLPNMIDILKKQDYPRLKANLDKVWHHFVWQTTQSFAFKAEQAPSDAWHTTLEVVCRHLHKKLEARARDSPLAAPLRRCPNEGRLAVQYFPLT